MVVQPSDVLGSAAKIVWECLALSLAYGILTMALLQFLKDMYAREFFNQGEFNKHFPRSTPGAAAIRSQLIQLAAGGDESALFGLPIDKLAGQINVAAGTVIESPAHYPELLRVLSYGATEDDIALLVETDPKKLQTIDPTSETASLRIDYADARTRISHQIQRNIDKLQLSASQGWTRLNQGLSLVVSVALGLLPVLLARFFPAESTLLHVAGFVPLSIVLSLVGGFLAPILRDLAAQASQKG